MNQLVNDTFDVIKNKKFIAINETNHWFASSHKFHFELVKKYI